MSTNTSDNIIKSIREAGKILRGEVADLDSRIVPTSLRRKRSRSLGVFVGVDEDFVTGKIYMVTPLASGRLAATSESGESVILDGADFLLVKFQPKAEKLIREIVAA